MIRRIDRVDRQTETVFRALALCCAAFGLAGLAASVLVALLTGAK
jgi:hypothetical protein